MSPKIEDYRRAMDGCGPLSAEGVAEVVGVGEFKVMADLHALIALGSVRKVHYEGRREQSYEWVSPAPRGEG